MLIAPIPINEFNRTQALRELKILDSAEDLRFDLITQFSSQTFKAPICAISLIDTKRQWFKSAVGIIESEIPRSLSICAFAIYVVKPNCNPADKIYEITDTLNDPKFACHPQVSGPPHLRSYISYVIQSKSGLNIGTICVADTKPRTFCYKQKQTLISLGNLTEKLVNNCLVTH